MESILTILQAGLALKQRIDLLEDNAAAWKELKPRVSSLIMLLQQRSNDREGCSAWVSKHVAAFQTLQQDLFFALAKVEKWTRRTQTVRGKLYSVLRAGKVQSQVAALAQRLDRSLLDLAVGGIDSLATGVDEVAAGVSGIASSVESISAGVSATSAAVRGVEATVSAAHADVSDMRRSVRHRMEGIAHAIGSTGEKVDAALKTSDKAARQLQRLKAIVPAKYHSTLFSSVAATAQATASGPGKPRYSVIRRATNAVTASGTAFSQVDTQLDVFGASSSAVSQPADPLAGQRVKRIAWSELLFEEGRPEQERQAGQLLGHGGNGAVLKATWGSTPVAVKVLWLSLDPSLPSSSALSSFLSEALAAWDMVHPRINPVLAVAVDTSDAAQPQFGLVMQYAAGGSLRAVLDDCAHIRLSLSRRLTWLVQIAEGLEYMHRQGKVHGDLKAANVLLDDRSDASLCDFGFTAVSALRGPGAASSAGSSGAAAKPAAVGKDGKYQSSGSLLWRAPEQFYDPELGGPAAPSQASDVYAFGVTAWEVLTRGMPWVHDLQVGQTGFIMGSGKLPGDNILKLMAKQLPKRVIGGERPSFELWKPLLPPVLVRLIEQCWAEEAKVRPAAAEIVVVLKSILAVAGQPAVSTADAMTANMCPFGARSVLECEGRILPAHAITIADRRESRIGTQLSAGAATMQTDLESFEPAVQLDVASGLEVLHGELKCAHQPTASSSKSGRSDGATEATQVLLVPITDGPSLFLARLAAENCGACSHCRGTTSVGPHLALCHPLGFVALSTPCGPTIAATAATATAVMYAVLPKVRSTPVSTYMPWLTDRSQLDTHPLYDPLQYQKALSLCNSTQAQRLAWLRQAHDAVSHMHTLGMKGGWCESHNSTQVDCVGRNILIGPDGRALLRLSSRAAWSDPGSRAGQRTSSAGMGLDTTSPSAALTLSGVLPSFADLADLSARHDLFQHVPPAVLQTPAMELQRFAWAAFSLLSYRAQGESCYTRPQWMWSFNEQSAQHGSNLSHAYWESRTQVHEEMLPPSVDGSVRRWLKGAFAGAEGAPRFKSPVEAALIAQNIATETAQPHEAAATPAFPSLPTPEVIIRLPLDALLQGCRLGGTITVSGLPQPISVSGSSGYSILLFAAVRASGPASDLCAVAWRGPIGPPLELTPISEIGGQPAAAGGSDDLHAGCGTMTAVLPDGWGVADVDSALSAMVTCATYLCAVVVPSSSTNSYEADKEAGALTAGPRRGVLRITSGGIWTAVGSFEPPLTALGWAIAARTPMPVQLTWQETPTVTTTETAGWISGTVELPATLCGRLYRSDYRLLFYSSSVTEMSDLSCPSWWMGPHPNVVASLVDLKNSRQTLMDMMADTSCSAERPTFTRPPPPLAEAYRAQLFEGGYPLVHCDSEERFTELMAAFQGQQGAVQLVGAVRGGAAAVPADSSSWRFRIPGAAVLWPSVQGRDLPILHAHLVPAGARNMIASTMYPLPPFDVECFSVAKSAGVPMSHVSTATAQGAANGSSEARIAPLDGSAPSTGNAPWIALQPLGLSAALSMTSLQMPTLMACWWATGSDRRWTLRTGSRLKMRSWTFGWAALAGPDKSVLQYDGEAGDDWTVFTVVRTQEQEQRLQEVLAAPGLGSGAAEGGASLQLLEHTAALDKRLHDGHAGEDEGIVTFHLRHVATGLVMTPSEAAMYKPWCLRPLEDALQLGHLSPVPTVQHGIKRLPRAGMADTDGRIPGLFLMAGHPSHYADRAPTTACVLAWCPGRWTASCCPQANKPVWCNFDATTVGGWEYLSVEFLS